MRKSVSERNTGSIAGAGRATYTEKSDEDYPIRKDSGYLSPQSRSRTPENVLDDDVFRRPSQGMSSSSNFRRSQFLQNLSIDRDDY